MSPGTHKKLNEQLFNHKKNLMTKKSQNSVGYTAAFYCSTTSIS